MNVEYLLRCANALERISLVLGALYADKFGELELGEKAKKLQQIGFSNTEIAQLLGTSANSIGVLMHLKRKQKAKSKRGKKQVGE
jgi:hypothetical protein